MELAGLSVAEATFKSFPLAKKVLVVVGPGNNGAYEWWWMCWWCD